MCLRVVRRDEARSEAELKLLEQGARDLCAAFQNVNFLRDLADDTERLARNYLSDGRVITEQLKLHWTNTIREQLEGARQSLPPVSYTHLDVYKRQLLGGHRNV